MICSNFKLSNLNFAIFCECRLYGGESVNINAGIVTRPRAVDSVCVAVSLEQLQAHGEWKLFKDVREAPAGQLNESEDVSRKPVGAV
jgi:hypothetical protein